MKMFPALGVLLALGLLVTILVARQGRLEEELAGLRKEALSRLTAWQEGRPMISQTAPAVASAASSDREPGMEPTLPPAEPTDRLGQLQKTLKGQAKIVEQVGMRLAERERHEREIEAAIQSTTVLSLDNVDAGFLGNQAPPIQNWRSTFRHPQKFKTLNSTNAIELSGLRIVPTPEIDHKSGERLGE